MISVKKNKILTTISALFYSFLLSQFYLWGDIDIYIDSLFRFKYNEKISNTILELIFSIFSLFISVGFFFSYFIIKKFGLKTTLAVSSILPGIILFSCSYINVFLIFIIIYGIIFPFILGIAFYIIIIILWNYYKENKGFITGYYNSLIGIGSFVNNYIMLFLINPKNIHPIKDKDGNKYFPNDVALNVPNGIRYFSLIIFIGGSIGYLLIQIPKISYKKRLSSIEEKEIENNNYLQNNLTGLNNSSNLKNNEKKEEENDLLINYAKNEDKALVCMNYTFIENITIWKKTDFLLFLLLMVFGLLPGIMLTSVIKIYGIMVIPDDAFITNAFSIAIFINGISRIFYGITYDKTSFSAIYIPALLLSIIFVVTFDIISSNKILFLIWVIVIFLCEGAFFTIFSPIILDYYGIEKGPIIYSSLLFSTPLSNLILFLFIGYVEPKIGFRNFFFLIGSFLILPMIFFVYKRNDMRIITKKF